LIQALTYLVPVGTSIPKANPAYNYTIQATKKTATDRIAQRKILPDLGRDNKKGVVEGAAFEVALVGATEGLLGRRSLGLSSIFGAASKLNPGVATDLQGR
jgi:hypothetical protein